ncbi:hypothetical protein IHE55_17430 [Streptomyces pactum]|uniref:DUF1795 domain-containing protein n=1 Tax=Streptomyces pactum TaxID=68249 RepID=A0ABS0NMM0_9ACTN|nr:hypothetical protein [Streptomyces pactum]MBH5336460.1 hypothetical protein [Streptomyces pactum]
MPDGYHLVTEKELGVSFPVPDGWTRKAGQRPGEVDYIDPTGMVNLQLNVMDFAAADPVEHFEDVERMFSQRYPVNERLRLQSTTFRGVPAAIWEFRFKGTARWFRAIDLGWGRPGSDEYALYLSAPEGQWQQYRGVFDHVRDGLRLSPATRAGSGTGPGGWSGTGSGTGLGSGPGYGSGTAYGTGAGLGAAAVPRAAADRAGTGARAVRPAGAVSGTASPGSPQVASGSGQGRP